MRRNIFISHLNQTSLKETFSIVKSIEFYSFDVKAVVTKRSRVQHSVKTYSEEKKCDKKKIFF